MQQTHLKTVEEHYLAPGAPHAHQSLDDYVSEEGDVGCIVVPKEHALEVEGEIRVAVFVLPQVVVERVIVDLVLRVLRLSIFVLLFLQIFRFRHG